MLRFFRHIRKSLMEQNKVRTYIFYSIGEIALVMVGILLALQVSNWNQQNYERDLEGKYLQELMEDFKENKRNADRVIGVVDRILPALISLLEQSALEAPDLSLDSLNTWYKEMNIMPTFRSTDRAYTNITGSGELKIISNDDIKYAMAMYYSRLEVLRLVQNTHELELVETFQPYIIENMDFQAVHAERVDEYPLPDPVDEAAIFEVLHTREFRNILTAKWTISTDLLNQFREINILIDDVIKLIEEELNQENN